MSYFLQTFSPVCFLRSAVELFLCLLHRADLFLSFWFKAVRRQDLWPDDESSPACLVLCLQLSAGQTRALAMKIPPCGHCSDPACLERPRERKQEEKWELEEMRKGEGRSFNTGDPDFGKKQNKKTTHIHTHTTTKTYSNCFQSISHYYTEE